MAYRNSNSHFKDCSSEKLRDLQNLALLLKAYKNTGVHYWKVPAQRNTAIILAISSTFAILGGLQVIRFFISSNQLIQPFSLAQTSILLALLALILLTLAVFKFINKSARRHIVLFEVFLSGFFGLTFSSYGWLYDANIHLDKSPAQISNYKVIEKYTERHRRRKGGSYTTYHFHLNEAKEPMTPRIKVDQSLYSQVPTGDYISISIRKGYFKQPWIENIQKCSNCEQNW